MSSDQKPSTVAQSMHNKQIEKRMSEIPFKKRRLCYQSGSPSAETPKESNSSEHLAEPEQLPASQQSHSEIGVIQGSVAVTSADVTSEVRNASNVETPVAVVPMDKAVASLKPDRSVKSEPEDRQGLLVQVDSPNSNKNDGASGNSIPLRTERLHWDLNLMMDEWEKPSTGIANQQINNSEYVTNDGLQNREVTSDPDSIQKIADPQCMLLETKGPDSDRNALQVSSGLINTGKTQDPTMTISMNDLNNDPRLDRPESEFVEQKNDSANIPMQYDKDMSRTPATVICKLASQSDTTNKGDSFSFSMPNIGKPACYVDSMKDEGSEASKLKLGKDPKDPNSNFCGNNTGHVISAEYMSNLQSGYDSPPEDGELREPDAYFWKNNEVECLDTGNLNNGMVATDYINTFENNYKNGNHLRDHWDNANAKGQDGKLDDNSLQAREFGARKYRKDDANTKGQDGELDDDGTQTREFGARKYSKKLSSFVETPFNGPKQRKNSPSMQRQRKNKNNGCEVDFSVSYQESRSYRSHSYRDSRDHDHSRLRRLNSGSPARGSEMSFDGNRQFSDKFSNDIYGTSSRKRLPAYRDYRDDSYDSYRRAPPQRGNKKRNKKKKDGFCPKHDRRAPKGEPKKHLPEKYSSRRDHKSSINSNQAPHTSRPDLMSQSESSLCSPTNVSNEQDQRSLGRVSRHNQRWRGKHKESPKKTKSDGNSGSSGRHRGNSEADGKGRER